MKKLVGVNITSPYQLLSVISYYQANSSIYDSIIIYKYDAWGANQISNLYLDYFNSIGGVIIEGVKGTLNIVKDMVNRFGRKDIDFVSVGKVDPLVAVTFYKSRRIVIADGFGSYGSVYSFYKAIRREGQALSLFCLYAVCHYVFKSLFNRLITFEPYAFYNLKTMEPDFKFTAEFKNVCKKINPSNDVLFGDSKILLVAEQPLVKLGLLSSEEYEKVLKNIRQYAEKNGLKLVLKKHPSEVFASGQPYDYICNSRIVEDICINNPNITHVVSHSSSSLFNLALIDKEMDVISFLSELPPILSTKQKILFSKVRRMKF